MDIIGHIYYIFGGLVIIKHLFQIFAFGSIYRVNEWHFRYKELIGRDPKKEEFRSREEYDLGETNKVLVFFEFAWVLCGLFSGSWAIFAAVLAVSIGLSYMLNAFSFTLFGKAFSVFLILSKLSLYLLLIANHFHYHLDLWEIFRGKI